jgi:hypothetical protein
VSVGFDFVYSRLLTANDRRLHARRCKRAGMLIFKVTDPAQVAKINEPMFAKPNAAISIVPVLTMEDLRKGPLK